MMRKIVKTKGKSFRQEAEEYLRKRGEEESPRPLVEDLEDWLREQYHWGREGALAEVRAIRDEAIEKLDSI